MHFPGRTPVRRCGLACSLVLAAATALADPSQNGSSDRSAASLPGSGGDLLRSIEFVSNPLNPEPAGPVLLRGVVTLVRRRVVYVQDQTGAIAVYPEGQARLAIGDEVEMQGEFRRRNSGSGLYGALIRKLWSGSPPVPLSLKPEQAAEGSYRDRLIDTEGKLIQTQIADGYLRLTIEGDRQLFGASLELSSTGRTPQFARDLEEGAILRLVGVCSPSRSPEESFGNAFVVLLRSTDDIRVVVPAPWWNLRHTVWVGCAALALISAFYVLRHRALNLRFQAIVEERSRIAREMHDTLAQGFSGLTYQLEGLSRELDASFERESIEQHLSMALQLVRHCREEAHRSIFALRSLTQTQPDLLSLLESSCDSMLTRRDVRLTCIRDGKPAPIPDEAMNHILRIGQEAITNALQHAGATEVAVAARFRDSELTLEVADNGRGFDTARAGSIESGRFGITGMRERARHLQGQFEIESAPGAGTKVRVRVRYGPESRWRRMFGRRAIAQSEKGVGVAS